MIVQFCHSTRDPGCLEPRLDSLGEIMDERGGLEDSLLRLNEEFPSLPSISELTNLDHMIYDREEVLTSGYGVTKRGSYILNAAGYYNQTLNLGRISMPYHPASYRALTDGQILRTVS